MRLSKYTDEALLHKTSGGTERYKPRESVNAFVQLGDLFRLMNANQKKLCFGNPSKAMWEIPAAKQ